MFHSKIVIKIHNQQLLSIFNVNCDYIYTGVPEIRVLILISERIRQFMNFFSFCVIN
jgi:hypothetical protein